MELHFINFYENTGEDLPHYLEVMQKLGYVWGHHYLPHDAKAKRFGTKLTVEEQMKAVHANTHIIPAQSIIDGINAARTIFSRCYFDEAACGDGLQHLRYYRFSVDPHTHQYSLEPKHDQHSHAADAFRYSALSTKRPMTKPDLDLESAEKKVRRPLLNLDNDQSTGWMS
jgi:phage terminase large subunit